MKKKSLEETSRSQRRSLSKKRDNGSKRMKEEKKRRKEEKKKRKEEKKRRRKEEKKRRESSTSSCERNNSSSSSRKMKRRQRTISDDDRNLPEGRKKGFNQSPISSFNNKKRKKSCTDSTSKAICVEERQEPNYYYYSSSDKGKEGLINSNLQHYEPIRGSSTQQDGGSLFIDRGIMDHMDTAGREEGEKEDNDEEDSAFALTFYQKAYGLTPASNAFLPAMIEPLSTDPPVPPLGGAGRGGGPRDRSRQWQCTKCNRWNYVYEVQCQDCKRLRGYFK